MNNITSNNIHTDGQKILNSQINLKNNFNTSRLSDNKKLKNGNSDRKFNYDNDGKEIKKKKVENDINSNFFQIDCAKNSENNSSNYSEKTLDIDYFNYSITDDNDDNDEGCTYDNNGDNNNDNNRDNNNRDKDDRDNDNRDNNNNYNNNNNNNNNDNNNIDNNNNDIDMNNDYYSNDNDCYNDYINVHENFNEIENSDNKNEVGKKDSTNEILNHRPQRSVD